MIEKNINFSNATGCSFKRSEDVTVEELKSLPIFFDRSDEELQAVIDAAKAFTKTVFDIYTHEQSNKNTLTQNLIIKTQKKAA